MKQLQLGPFEVRILQSPRVYVRVGRLVVMYWPRENLRKRLEIQWAR